MKRLLVLVCTFSLCSFLVGCGSDSKEGLIEDTIILVQDGATAIGNINAKVKDAIKKAAEKDTKLELADAGKAADQLKQLGEHAQKIKRRIELDRASITDADREIYVTNKRKKLEDAFADLIKQHNDLNKSLKNAEQISQAAKDAVEKLRERIRDAESPFEALAR